ncbi:MAG: hypothetical protein LBV74_05590 [Tannerella sp.]|nr:hypothetical protein [Tannerella sp.]
MPWKREPSSVTPSIVIVYGPRFSDVNQFHIQKTAPTFRNMRNGIYLISFNPNRITSKIVRFIRVQINLLRGNRCILPENLRQTHTIKRIGTYRGSNRYAQKASKQDCQETYLHYYILSIILLSM